MERKFIYKRGMLIVLFIKKTKTKTKNEKQKQVRGPRCGTALAVPSVFLQGLPCMLLSDRDLFQQSTPCSEVGLSVWGGKRHVSPH